MKKINLAIIGATGLVGETIRTVLEEREFPINKVFFYSSPRSAGEEIEFMGEKVVVEELKDDSFKGRKIDIALFSAGGNITEKYAPIAIEEGIIVIDNSSNFRMDKDVPLIVPEVNGDEIFKNKGLIANPNCSTIQSVVVIKPIYEKYGIKRIVYNTYQAVSGTGVKGIEDLETGKPNAYPYSINKNCLPHIDDFLDNGYTKEEMKMIDETIKILNDSDLKITATTVRVPIRNSHAVSINLELEKEFDIEDIFKILQESEGIIVKDDLENLKYPLAEDSNGKDEVFVGRIRRDFSLENGINLWCVADNIRKGAATNTIQIAEEILKKL